jgi:hypothetical protein
MNEDIIAKAMEVADFAEQNPKEWEVLRDEINRRREDDSS